MIPFGAITPSPDELKSRCRDHHGCPSDDKAGDDKGGDNGSAARRAAGCASATASPRQAPPLRLRRGSAAADRSPAAPAG